MAGGCCTMMSCQFPPSNHSKYLRHPRSCITAHPRRITLLPRVPHRSTSNCGNPALRLFGFGKLPEHSLPPHACHISASFCGADGALTFVFVRPGPVVSDGFGLGYIIKDEGMQICCTSFRRAVDRFYLCVWVHLTCFTGDRRSAS